MQLEYNNLKEAIVDNSGNGLLATKAYLNLEDGQIHLILEDDEFDFNDETILEDIKDPTKFLQLPSIEELVDLNKLALDFAEQKLPEKFEALRSFLRSSGGTHKFFDMIENLNAISIWQEFRDNAYAEAIKKWSVSHNLNLI